MEVKGARVVGGLCGVVVPQVVMMEAQLEGITLLRILCGGVTGNNQKGLCCICMYIARILCMYMHVSQSVIACIACVVVYCGKQSAGCTDTCQCIQNMHVLCVVRLVWG